MHFVKGAKRVISLGITCQKKETNTPGINRGHLGPPETTWVDLGSCAITWFLGHTRVTSRKS